MQIVFRVLTVRQRVEYRMAHLQSTDMEYLVTCSAISEVYACGMPIFNPYFIYRLKEAVNRRFVEIQTHKITN